MFGSEAVSDLLCRFAAIDSWQYQVHQYQVEMTSSGNLDTGFSVNSGDDRIAGERQPTLEHKDVVVVVYNVEYGCHQRFGIRR